MVLDMRIPGYSDQQTAPGSFTAADHGQWDHNIGIIAILWSIQIIQDIVYLESGIDIYISVPYFTFVLTTKKKDQKQLFMEILVSAFRHTHISLQCAMTPVSPAPRVSPSW